MRLNLQLTKETVHQLKLMEKNDIPLELMEENYFNCHRFTMDFILSLYNSGLFEEKMRSQFICDNMKTLCNNSDKSKGKNEDGIRNMYMDLIKNGAETFEKTNMNEKIQCCSLILFADPGNGFVAHSMIALNPNVWIGANNISSLGPNGSGDLSGGFLEYKNMSERCHSNGKKPQGGWLCHEDAATGEKEYVMHYCTQDAEVVMYAIPLFDERYPILFNLVSSAGGDGCCLIV